MLTVKLCKGPTMKIVEATEVNVYNCGPFRDSDQDPTKRVADVREIAGTTPEGKTFAFYIVDPNKPMPEGRYGFAPEVGFGIAPMSRIRAARRRKQFARTDEVS